MLNLRRSQRQSFGNYPSGLFEGEMELAIFRRIGRRELRNFGCGSFEVAIEDKRAAVGGKRGDSDVRHDEFNPVPFQLHVADDLRTQGSGGVSQHRRTKSRMELLRNGGAADLTAA